MKTNDPKNINVEIFIEKNQTKRISSYSEIKFSR
jgi:hypothetical protein